MDKLDCINTFISVVEHGNFSSASRNLGITRDQVAKRICYLETLFDSVLFIRNTRNMSLTHSGEKFYQHSKVIMSEFEWATSDFTYDQEFPGGVLRINAPLSFQQTYLSEIISNFMTLYPLIKIDLFLSDKVIDINEENYDISLRISQKNTNEPHVHLFSIHHKYFYATKNYFKNHGKPKTLEELKQHNLLLYSQTKLNNKIILTKNKKEESFYCTPQLICNSGSFLLELCKRNQGIIYLPSFLVEKEEILGNISRCLEDYHSPPLHFYAITSSKKRPPRTLKLFLDHLKKFLTNTSSIST